MARARRRRRLSRSAEFERVYRHGRSKGNRFLVLYAFPREVEPPGGGSDGSDGPRLGLSVSRRVGGAVERNRVKRVLREAFWQEAQRLPSGSDYVVVARPEARELTEREGVPGIRTALADLVDGLGGSPSEAGGREAGDRPDAGADNVADDRLDAGAEISAGDRAEAGGDTSTGDHGNAGSGTPTNTPPGAGRPDVGAAAPAGDREGAGLHTPSGGSAA